MFGKKKKKRGAYSSMAEEGGEGFWGSGGSAPDSPPPPLDQAESVKAYQAGGLGREKSLLEFLDPLFLRVCMHHRVLAEGGNPTHDTVRSDIEGILQQLDQEANSSPSLRSHYEFLKEPMKWFLDCMFGTYDSRFPEAFWQEWQRNYLSQSYGGEDGGELTGGDLFFIDKERGLDTMLDEAKFNRNDLVANERLAFYYICIGLGLKGRYYDEPEKLRDYSDRIFPRISHLLETEPEEKLTPKAYDHLNLNNFVSFVRERPKILFAAFIAFLFAVLFAYSWLHYERVAELMDAVRDINEGEP